VALERRVDLEQVVPAGGVRPLSDVAAEDLQLSTVVLVRPDVELSDGLGPPGRQAENPEQPFDQSCRTVFRFAGSASAISISGLKVGHA
jgi:hypothetical protein